MEFKFQEKYLILFNNGLIPFISLSDTYSKVLGNILSIKFIFLFILIEKEYRENYLNCLYKLVIAQTILWGEVMSKPLMLGKTGFDRFADHFSVGVLSA